MTAHGRGTGRRFIDQISFPAMDGYVLTGTLFLPRGAKRQADTLWRGIAEWRGNKVRVSG